MNIHTLKNEFLTVEINSLGANLWSIKDQSGTEYLWQGDVNSWPDKSMNLFPYIARLTEGKYRLYGKEYHMDIHGFVKDSVLDVVFCSESEIVLQLEDSEETRRQYPYRFTYEISYRLVGKEIQVNYKIINKDEKLMYFGIGGHPGFNVPLEKELDFCDYVLTFSEKKDAMRVGMSEDCFVTEKDNLFVLKEGVCLPLEHNMFDDDAIILRNMAHQVTLQSDKGSKGVRVTYPKMDYLGIWHWPKMDVPYICIEPWSSLPSRKDVVESLESQENLVCLDANKTYENTWTIEII